MAEPAPRYPKELVRDLQRRLHAIGHGYVAIDGIYGPATENAVRVFQQEREIEGDGEWNPQTQTILWQATSKMELPIGPDEPPPLREVESMAESASQPESPTEPPPHAAGGSVAEPAPQPEAPTEPPAAPARWTLSDSVDGLRSRFTSAVTAHELACLLISDHPTYPGQEALPEIEHPPPDATRKAVDEWFDAIRPVFDDSVTKLHGRLLVVGLALVEVDLGERLARLGVLEQLVNTVRELPDAFTEKGREYFAGVSELRDDAVPIIGDRPTDVDRLGRALFAEVLAERLRYIRGERAEAKGGRFRRRRRVRTEGSFLVHVDGPWGIGKSSVLRFLAAELGTGDRAANSPSWVVVWFNAWQHQRVAPPWWWLMTAVYRQSRRELWRLGDWRYFLLVGRGLWWRLRDGWMAYVLLPIAGVLLYLVWTTEVFGLTDFQDKDALEVLEFLAKTFGTFTGLVLSVWGVVRGVNRWLLFGSARGADAVLKRGHDPMDILRRRYRQLIRTTGRPVAVLVDDLDRCQAAYVVELLEGIQTLFVDEPVTYVVAADKGWLSDSYAKVYEDFVTQADEPARPLGYLFLEKTFQLSVRVPHLSPRVRDAYWAQLLRLAQQDEPSAHRGFWLGLGRLIHVVPSADEPRRAPEAAQAVEAAEDALRTASSEEQVLATVASVAGEATVEAEELRKASIRRLQDPQIERRTAHTLEGFAEWLEDNPRAMKKLLNTYGIERDLHVRRGRTITTLTRKRLALWMIMGLRWPLLTEFLTEHPSAVASLGDGAVVDDLDEQERKLLADPDVRALIRAQEPSVRLTEASLRYILDRSPPATSS